ncbi:MAG: GGDEF-domain containing protein [Burkholderiales bacterium PBB4]|nr:MAG: GGDEF-domain containing protein [Burkholderiales bacterium PBB4]
MTDPSAANSVLQSVTHDFDSQAHIALRLKQFARLVCGGLTVATVQYSFMGMPHVPWITGAGAIAMLLADWLGRHGALNASVLLLFGTSGTVPFVIMWMGAGLADSILLGFPVLLMAAGQMLRPRYFFFVMAAIILGVVAIGTTSMLGWRTSTQQDTDFNRMTDSVLMLLVGGTMVLFLSRDMFNAMRRLRLEIVRYQESERNLSYLARHDPLTHLPNRMLANELIEQALRSAERQDSQLALLFVDLDNFKDINDSMGHAAGDDFLKQVADRLRGVVRKGDIVCRQGGDEFLVGLVDVGDSGDISGIADNLLAAIAQPFVVRESEILASCSIGIAVHPHDGADFEELLRHADLAMYEAKASGRNTCRFFDDELNTNIQQNLHLLSNLRLAIAQQEFVLHYQPVIDLATGKLIGAEALVRWNSPSLGLVAPLQFIAAAEKSGLIVDIGQWVITEACQQMRAWHAAGATGLTIAVNLSPVQFRRGNMEELIAQALSLSGLDPACLELEVTEFTLVQDTEKFIQTLQRLKALGIRISIDDFGTGYSNLSYLQRFAVDTLKIDQSFVKTLTSNAQNQTLVTAIIQMAKGLNLTTIAEGIEDIATRDQLLALGCDQGQGYGFAKPLAPEDFWAYTQAKGSAAKASAVQGLAK